MFEVAAPASFRAVPMTRVPGGLAKRRIGVLRYKSSVELDVIKQTLTLRGKKFHHCRIRLVNYGKEKLREIQKSLPKYSDYRAQNAMEPEVKNGGLS
mmetsp:Transcript_11278/g.21627  ORF Transcript_11278/g.21627 Transcript_11278/m.21627 type:complete len:97 (-) Transcript_11278:793-1083(-)